MTKEGKECGKPKKTATDSLGSRLYFSSRGNFSEHAEEKHYGYCTMTVSVHLLFFRSKSVRKKNISVTTRKMLHIQDSCASLYAYTHRNIHEYGCKVALRRIYSTGEVFITNALLL